MSNWADQPWLNEPLYDTWTHSSGLVCEIARQTLTSNWCGYVQVPPDHPIRVFDLNPQEWDEDSPRYVKLEVHGGVTWSSAVNLDTCPEKDVYRVGFDCVHCGDLRPDSLEFAKYGYEWRDVNYVRLQTNLLAAQISKIKIIPEGFAL